MNTQDEFSSFSISPGGIEAIVSKARAERAEAMRAALSRMPVLFKRLAARLHSNREPRRGEISALAPDLALPDRRPFLPPERGRVFPPTARAFFRKP